MILCLYFTWTLLFQENIKDFKVHLSILETLSLRETFYKFIEVNIFHWYCSDTWTQVTPDVGW